MSDYGNTKADAVRAEADGLPSILPNSNPYKGAVEDHRWGKRGPGHRSNCPVCSGMVDDVTEAETA